LCPLSIMNKLLGLQKMHPMIITRMLKVVETPITWNNIHQPAR
jgi:hypothetical protein